MKEIKAELTPKEVLLKENYIEEEWNELREEHLHKFDFLIDILRKPLQDYLKGEDDYVEIVWKLQNPDYQNMQEMFNFFTGIQDEDINIINIDSVYIEARDKFLGNVSSALLQCNGCKKLIDDIEIAFDKEYHEIEYDELYVYLDEYFLKIDENKLDKSILFLIKNECDYGIELVMDKLFFYNSYVSKNNLLQYFTYAYEGRGENRFIRDPYTGREYVFESVFPLLENESIKLKTYLHRYIDVQEVEEGEYRINWRLQKKNKN